MLGIPVSTLGLTLGVLVLALDVTLQILGSTLDRVIVVDGLVDDNSGYSGSDSKQYLQRHGPDEHTKDTGPRLTTAGRSSDIITYVWYAGKSLLQARKAKRREAYVQGMKDLQVER